MNRKPKKISIISFLLISLLLCACLNTNNNNDIKIILDSEKNFSSELSSEDTLYKFKYSEIPEYSGEPFAILNNGIPYFSDNEIVTQSYENYGELDSLGRCTECIACISLDTMPPEGEKRGDIGNIKPSGWIMKKYNCVNGQYCINRSHLIAWMLGYENANPNNLITGTRYMNLEMEELELTTRDYIKETSNHVMYRVTPIFIGEELMCRGVLMEVYSCEDQGKGLCFCQFYYNVQPGLEFDYSTGNSWYTGDFLDTDSIAVVYDSNYEYNQFDNRKYTININTKKFHLSSCTSVNDIAAQNKMEFNGTIDELINQGFSPCKRCIKN